MFTRRLLAALVPAVLATSAHAGVTLIGTGTLSGPDMSGLTGALESGASASTLGGIGSGGVFPVSLSLVSDLVGPEQRQIGGREILAPLIPPHHQGPAHPVEVTQRQKDQAAHGELLQVGVKVRRQELLGLRARGGAEQALVRIAGRVGRVLLFALAVQQRLQHRRRVRLAAPDRLQVRAALRHQIRPHQAAIADRADQGVAQRVEDRRHRGAGRGQPLGQQGDQLQALGLALGTMSGAIFFHLTRLGIEVQGDGGLLFTLACVVWVCSAALFWRHRRTLPVIGRLL